jgi:TolB-like protein/DNA-binding winged helix-turn-helix (wHTH) protein/tetratricopeptide (TPR) repeat protein
MDALMDADGTLRFGSFELDVRSRELRTGGGRVRLQEQPFEILRMMLERPGAVVTRDELRQRLWPDGTFVDFEHSLNAAVKRLRAALGDEADNPRFVETLPRRGYRFIGALGPAGPGTTADALPRVAVLPFANLSDDESQEYFTDGLTEEMIAQLGQRSRGRLGVIARWSSMVFKGSTQRSRAIGQALRAQYLLEGSVRREGDRVRVTASLVEASSETHLWSQSYERHLTDCLLVQSDIAARIAESLALELVADERPAASGTACSASAYQEYLKGRYHWNHWQTPDDQGVEQALAYFNEALRIDPQFAPAYASVSRVHVARAAHYREAPRRALEAARTAAKRALELEPELFEAHLAIADIRRMLEWDWRGAEAAYVHAISLNPSQENAHRGYGSLLVALSRSEEAVRESERACELDPLCLVVNTTAAWVRYLAGDFDAALERCRRTGELDPHYLPARRIMGVVYLQAGRTADALEVLDAAHREAPQDPILLASLAYANAVAGDHVAAAALLARIRRLDRARYLPPYHLAVVHVGLGDAEQAFAALERATVDADPALGYVAVDPRLQPIRSDPRYARLVDLLGLG